MYVSDGTIERSHFGHYSTVSEFVKFVGFIEVCMGDGFRIVRDPAEGSFGPTQS